jgi:hypothetical protein
MSLISATRKLYYYYYLPLPEHSLIELLQASKRGRTRQDRTQEVVTSLLVSVVLARGRGGG